MTKKAVFLDRDGVINRAFIDNGVPKPPSTLAEVEILPRVKEALFLLKKLGFLLIVITNQPDIARGVISQCSADNINKYLMDKLPLDEIIPCYHDDDDNCQCRKPKPGSILKSVNLYDIDVKKSFMIGDRWRDIEAGLQSGCKTIFINYGYKEKQPIEFTFEATSLYDASIKIKQLEGNYEY